MPSRIAWKAGETRALSPRAIRLLSVLAEANGTMVSRQTLLDRVWPEVVVSDESLTQVVAEVRRVLSDKRIIETVSRGGYRLSQAPMQAAPNAAAPHRSEPTLADLEAHALCLEARTELVRCGAGSIQRAVELTEEAVDMAPECAVSLAELSVALTRSHLYWSEGSFVLPRAIEAAQQAVALDPGLTAGHSALGYALGAGQHWQAADAAHRHALTLNPRSAAAYHLAAWYLMSSRRHRAAITYFEQVGHLEPENIKGYLHAAQLSVQIDPARSRRNAEKVLARARMRLNADPSDTRALAAIALMMALLGEPASALSTIDQIDVRESAQAIYVASALTLIGETDRAVLALEELFDHGWRDLPWLDTDPAFVTMAEHRQFGRLRRNLSAA